MHAQYVVGSHDAGVLSGLQIRFSLRESHSIEAESDSIQFTGRNRFS